MYLTTTSYYELPFRVTTSRIIATAFIVAMLAYANLAEAMSLAIGGAPIGVPLQDNSIELEASNFRYTLNDRSYLVDELATELPMVSLSDVLNDTDQTGYSCNDPQVIPPLLPSVSAAFCWDAVDSADDDWFPQGITTTADALNIGTYQGETVILVSWYNKALSGINKGSRLSFIDYSDPNNPVYRHVLLVEPSMSSGNITFDPVRVHAGGVVWYGNLVYVVDTSGGFRVFDMNQIFQVQEGQPTQVGRQTDGSYHAYDYKYVLPQVLEYEEYTTNSAGRISHSFVSLDRTTSPDSIIVGEFRYIDDVAGGAPTRIIRIPIDSRTRYLGNKYTDPLYASDVGAEEAFNAQIEHMQGATSVNGKFLVSSTTLTWYGTLYVLGGEPDPLLGLGDKMAYYGNLPAAPEDLSYWAAKDQLWTLGELTLGDTGGLLNLRAVVALKASDYINP